MAKKLVKKGKKMSPAAAKLMSKTMIGKMGKQAPSMEAAAKKKGK